MAAGRTVRRQSCARGDARGLDPCTKQARQAQQPFGPAEAKKKNMFKIFQNVFAYEVGLHAMMTA